MEKLTSKSIFNSWRETINDIIDEIRALKAGAVPKSHTSSSTEFGGATASLYGHVKLSDATDNTAGTANNSVAASAAAVAALNAKLGTISSKNINSSGRVTPAESNTNASDTTEEIPLGGVSMVEIYNTSSTPSSYGNIINLRGETSKGAGQIFCGWSGTDSVTEGVAYRSHRDTSTGGWGPWKKFLFSDNPVVDGDMTVGGNLKVDGQIESSQVFGAVWNDYAEFFERGEWTEVGDIIALDEKYTSSERYVRATKESNVVAGVHSNTFGHLIGGEHQPEGENYVDWNLKKFIPVALCGRVMVKVTGDISIGDKIAPSDIAGVGEKYNPEIHKYDQIVGTVVQLTGKPGMVKILVKK